MGRYYDPKTINFLRFGVIFLLGGLIAGLGAASYFLLSYSEIKDFTQNFASLSHQTDYGIQTNLQGKLSVILSLTNVYSQLLSSRYQNTLGIPPNITIEQLESVTLPSIRVMKLSNFGFMPVLNRKTRKSWEAYAKEMVGQLQLPNYLTNRSSGHWTIYDGIYEVDSSGEKIYDSGHAADSLFPDLVTPVWEVAPISFGDNIMYNMHSKKPRMQEIDMVVTYKSIVFSDLVETAGVPSSTIFAPILSLNTSQVLGLFFTTIPWDLILENVLPSYFSGVYFVLTTSTTSYTFLIENGKATSLGTGDLHDTRYTEYKKEISSLFSDLPIALSTDYKIAMYPTKMFYEDYNTSTPGIACGVVVALIVFTSVTIFFFEYVIQQRENRQKEDLVFTKLKSKLSDLVKRELETKNAFIRFVSHEVRNPLNIVALGLDHLKRQISEENKEAVDVIAELESATKQAVEIMDNLLTFEKLTSNILELQKVEVPVVSYIEENIRFMKIHAKHKAVELRLILDDSLNISLSAIAIDKRKINQVIQNLLSNAIRFSPPGKEVVVRASLVSCEISKDSPLLEASRRNENAQSLLKIEVIDEGPGISAENQKRLFREVVEFTPGEFHDGKGSGLSLWISHQIVARHEGVLSVQSEGLGKGTTFIMELPFLDDIDEIDRINKNKRPKKVKKAKSNMNPSVSRSLLTRISILANSFKPKSPSPPRLPNRLDEEEDVTSGMHGASRTSTTANNRARSRPGGEGDNVMAFQSEDCSTRSVGLDNGDLVDITNRCFNPSTKPNIKILVVDDVAMNRKMLTRLLEGKWDNISCAEDGKMASDMVREAAKKRRPYDIVLMDFEMPVMNGPDAAKVMRSEGYTGLIVGVTGNGLPADIERFIRQGADKVLLKPVSTSVLEELIASLMLARQFPNFHPFQNS